MENAPRPSSRSGSSIFDDNQQGMPPIPPQYDQGEPNDSGEREVGFSLNFDMTTIVCIVHILLTAIAYMCVICAATSKNSGLSATGLGTYSGQSLLEYSSN